ncbi:MAG: hypothetical protein OSA98_11860 [Rubripirellula sp.]|nr:hypothetical protein [Rubripirellula sp.]
MPHYLKTICKTRSKAPTTGVTEHAAIFQLSGATNLHGRKSINNAPNKTEYLTFLKNQQTLPRNSRSRQADNQSASQRTFPCFNSMATGKTNCVPHQGKPTNEEIS